MNETAMALRACGNYVSWHGYLADTIGVDGGARCALGVILSITGAKGLGGDAPVALVCAMAQEPEIAAQIEYTNLLSPECGGPTGDNPYMKVAGWNNSLRNLHPSVAAHTVTAMFNRCADRLEAEDAAKRFRARLVLQPAVAEALAA